MKKQIVLAAALLAGAAFTLLLPATPSRRAGGFEPAAARRGAAAAAILAAETIPAGAAPGTLNRAELEKAIAEIDARIESQHLVERSNRGELGEPELRELRGLLDQRNGYFLKKIDIDLGQG